MNDLERALAAATALQPGAVIAVLDGGVSLLATGHVDLEKSAALPPDAVFRIASLTKPITAAALVMLMDEHGVALSDPLAETFRNWVTASASAPAASRSVLGSATATARSGSMPKRSFSPRGTPS